MSPSVRTTLTETLSLHFLLSKSRLETLATLLLGLIHCRTVNLTHIASHFPGDAQHGSNYRRLQRFFQYIRLDQAVVARIVMRMLTLNRPVCLALDRTNWKVGHRDINVLVLAVVTRRFRVPLLWTMLDHQGNSNSDQRIALVKRFLALFGAPSIEMLLADREFVGSRWMAFLDRSKIPFAIRARSEMTLLFDNGRAWSFNTLVRGRRDLKTVRTWTGRLPETEVPVTLAAKQIAGGEWLFILTNTDDGKKAINTYRKRWAIECLFGDAKTRGLNMEDTHITNLGTSGNGLQ